VRFAAVAALKPAAGEGQRLGELACRKCQHVDSAPVGTGKGWRWVAVAERAEEAHVEKEMKAEAQATGGMSLTPKPTSCSIE
jgi:hypothetical protein